MSEVYFQSVELDWPPSLGDTWHVVKDKSQGNRNRSLDLIQWAIHFWAIIVFVIEVNIKANKTETMAFLDLLFRIRWCKLGRRFLLIHLYQVCNHPYTVKDIWHLVCMDNGKKLSSILSKLENVYSSFNLMGKLYLPVTKLI